MNGEMDYVSLFANSALAQGDALGSLALFFLFMARMLPIIALSPFLGARVLPHPVKVMLALTLFVIFLPKLLITVSTSIGFNWNTTMLIIKELFVGLCFGMLISMPFIIVQNAGIIIDHQRGGASLMVNDPTIQNQSSPLGTLFNMVLIYLFFQINGPFLFIESVASTYDIIPPDRFLHPGFFSEDTPFWRLIIALMGKVMAVSIQLATPALLIMLMTDLFLGIANRLAPQVQITFLGMALKSLLGLGIVCLGWPQLTKAMVDTSYYWLGQARDMIAMFVPGSQIPIQ